MICPKCKTENGEGASYCLSCGAKLDEVKEEVKEETQTEEVKAEEVKVEITPEVKEEVKEEKKEDAAEAKKVVKEKKKIDVLGYFKSIYRVFLKPSSAMDKELDNYNDIANSALMGLIVAVIATIIKLITTIIATARATSYLGAKWNWKLVGEINFFKEIFLSLLFFVGMILIFAGVCYLAGLVVKKETKFPKLMALATLGLIPYLLAYYLLSPILNLIWYPLAQIAVIAGKTYSLIILYEGLNKEISLEGDKKVYFNLVVFGILLTLLFLTNHFIMKSTAVDVSNQIKDVISDIFS